MRMKACQEGITYTQAVKTRDFLPMILEHIII